MPGWLLAVIVAPLAAIALVVFVREPLRVALPVFAALIPFGGALSIGTSRFGSVSSLVGLALGAGLVFQVATNRRSAPSLSAAVPVWLLFLAVAVASTQWSQDPPATISGVTVLASLVLVYVFTAVSHVDQTVLRRTENGLLAGGVAVVSYGLYQLVVLGGFPIAPVGGGTGQDIAGTAVTGPDGRFGNDLLGPGVEAVALLLPLVLALHRAFQERRPTSRTLYAVTAAFVFFGVLMTASRTGSLAAALVVLALALSGPRRARTGLLACLGLGLAIGTAVWLWQPAGVSTRTFGTITASSGRTDIWQVGIAACNRYCLYGSGWGTFPDVYAQTQASVPGARVLAGAGSYQPHNLWLLAVVELGIAGLVLLVWGLWLAVVEAWQLSRSRRGPPFSAIVGLIFAVFFLSSMEFKFFWMVLMLIAIHKNLASASAGDIATTSVTSANSQVRPGGGPAS